MDDKHIITIDGEVIVARRNKSKTCEGCTFLHKTNSLAIGNMCMFNKRTNEEYHTDYWRWGCHDNGHIWSEVKDATEET